MFLVWNFKFSTSFSNIKFITITNRFINAIIIIHYRIYIYKHSNFIINFKIRYKEHISEIKLKKSSPKSNFAKHVFECNKSIHFVEGKKLNILHNKKYKYINSALE